MAPFPTPLDFAKGSKRSDCHMHALIYCEGVLNYAVLELTFKVLNPRLSGADRAAVAETIGDFRRALESI
jgi:hypothetical protein